MSHIDPGGEGRRPRSGSSRGHSGLVGQPATGFPSGGEPSLSRPLTSFVGRDAERAKVLALFERHRLVTLTGVAGVGKSRLAVEAAIDVVDRCGVRRTDLSSVVDVAASSRAPLGSRPALLLLDNCELAPETASILARGALQDDSSSVLVTSRARLGLEGEVVWEVAPLPVLDSDEEGAVRLFLDRALAVGRSLDYCDGPHRADVLAICQRLDGIPLAIELAAGWLPVLSPGEIASRIDDVSSFLVDQRPTRTEGHRSIGASLQRSYDLLTAPEAAVLRRLSVFANGCDLQSAERVCTGDGVGQREDILRQLAGLARHSLLVTDYTSRGTRYRLHGIVRSFAREQLAGSGEEVVVRRRHAGWATELAEQAAGDLRTADATEARARLDIERENLRAALQWCSDDTDGPRALRLSTALATHWRIAGDLREGSYRLQSALAVSGYEKSQFGARARLALAYFTFMLGDRAKAFSMLEEGLALAEGFAEQATQADALVLLGFFLTFENPAAAVATVERAVTLAREVADQVLRGEALATLGRAHMLAGDPDAAARCWHESVGVAAAYGDRHTECHALIGLGWIAWERGEYGVGDAHLERAVGIARQIGDRFAAAAALCFRAEQSLRRGAPDDAASTFNEALRFARELGSPFPLTRCLLGLARLAQAQGALDTAAALCAEATDVANRAKLESHIRWSRVGLADVHMGRGDVGAARRLLEEALGSARDGGDRRAEARSLYGMAVLSRQAGDIANAKRCHREALAARVDIDPVPGVVDSIEGLAGIAVVEGRDRQAARLFGAAQALRDTSDLARRPSAATRYESDVALARSRLGADEFDRQWARGAALPLQDAVSHALHGRLVRSVTTGWGSLTPAELRVVRLAEQGLTNPQIGERLFVSPRTVSTHLSHAFAKLGVSSRVELARLASARGPAWDPAREYVT